jgi:hypothetical protein
MTGLACIVLAFLATGSAKSEFKRLRALETYEIQPGILMQPTYSSQGELCSVVLEKRHYSSQAIDLDAEMSHDQIWQIFDELAPKQDRGRSTFDLGDDGELTTVNGIAATTMAEYENVSLEMDGKTHNSDERDRKYVVAIIRWKKRKGCNWGRP